MKKFLIAVFIFCSLSSTAQDPVTVTASKKHPWENIYRGEATKINDLVHTKLDVGFDYKRSLMYGKAWLTLHPHFYATDSLNLDAKSMLIHEVAMVENGKAIPLRYSYDSMNLRITLDRMYHGGENYTVYINYTAQPDVFEAEHHGGSAAITDDKGLYFINPLGKEKDKPTQIWTQGETESNSVWMPTIDKPNQKTTLELNMTVPDTDVTLSNGLLVRQTNNGDGTRTDSWKLDQPFSPYLVFMGVGNYSVIKDSYEGKEVAYFVEKPFASVARKIFGLTPEMIAFYSKVLGVDYPWPKYDQMTGRDYISGAMENVTATLQTDAVQQNARQLVDGNKYEDFVSHELFHQWFGDLVTCESWSNVTMNESFADFSEQLWFEHKWGKDKGDEHAYEGLQKYLRSGEFNKDLVRFYYRDREDVFDNVSYEKGGRILNMLRNYVGDSAFFKALNLYLVTNAFKTGEAQQLRLAFEQVTGQDLNWFWNQWYYGSGHPVLDISYQYNDTAGVATVIINQKQEGSKLFKLPFAIDVYNGADKKRYHVWMNDRTDSFHFRYTNRPDLINVDGDKILLCEKTDHKTYENYIAQLKYAPLYLDRREALEYFAKNHKKELSGGLSDKYSGIRSFTLDKYQEDTSLLNGETLQVIESIAQHDPDKITQSKAIAVLAATGNKSYLPVFLKYTTDSSYSVSGEALQGLYNLDSNRAFLLAKKFSSDAKDRLGEVVNTILQERGTDRDFQLVAERYQSNHSRQKLRKETPQFCEYLARISDQDAIKAGVDLIIQYKNSLPESYKVYAGKIIQKCLEKLAAAKGGEISDYIKSMQP